MRHKRGNAKLNKPWDQRVALLRGQVSSLLLHGHITTTKVRAREVKRIAERMITRARAGAVHDMREAMKVLYTKEVLYSLEKNVLPAVKDRTDGGYLKEYKVGFRRGDGSLLVRLVVPGFPEQ
ncbi:MAG: 50S ribosomal protein L17 [bacterium]|jgi:large subunit ribosomal protein L17